MTGPAIAARTVLITLLGLQAVSITAIRIYSRRELTWLLVICLMPILGSRFFFPAGGLLWTFLTLVLLGTAGAAAALLVREGSGLLWVSGPAALVLAWSLALVLGYRHHPSFPVFSFGCLTAASFFPILALAAWLRRSPSPLPGCILVVSSGWVAVMLAEAGLGRSIPASPELWYCLALVGAATAYQAWKASLRWELGRIGSREEPENGDSSWMRLLELERLESVFFQQERIVSLGYLAAGMTHDFKNLLAYAATCAEHGLKSREPESKDRALEAIAENVRTAGTPVLAMLDALSVSRREEPRNVVLADWLSGFLSKIRKNFRLEGIVFTLEPDCRTAVRIRCGEIEQVLLNLVRNAVQAFRSHRAPPERRITVRCRQADGWSVIEVCDNAGGLDEQAGAAVFDLPPHPESARLGLFLSKKLITLNGGRVEHTPTEGGSCFRVALPDRPG